MPSGPPAEPAGKVRTAHFTADSTTDKGVNSEGLGRTAPEGDSKP